MGYYRLVLTVMRLWRLGGLGLRQGGLDEEGLKLDEIGSEGLWKPCLMPMWKQMEPKLRNQRRQFGACLANHFSSLITQWHFRK